VFGCRAQYGRCHAGITLSSPLPVPPTHAAPHACNSVGPGPGDISATWLLIDGSQGTATSQPSGFQGYEWFSSSYPPLDARMRCESASPPPAKHCYRECAGGRSTERPDSRTSLDISERKSPPMPVSSAAMCTETSYYASDCDNGVGLTPDNEDSCVAGFQEWLVNVYGSASGVQLVGDVLGSGTSPAGCDDLTKVSEFSADAAGKRSSVVIRADGCILENVVDTSTEMPSTPRVSSSAAAGPRASSSVLNESRGWGKAVELAPRPPHEPWWLRDF